MKKIQDSIFKLPKYKKRIILKNRLIDGLRYEEYNYMLWNPNERNLRREQIGKM